MVHSLIHPLKGLLHRSFLTLLPDSYVRLKGYFTAKLVSSTPICLPKGFLPRPQSSFHLQESSTYNTVQCTYSTVQSINLLQYSSFHLKCYSTVPLVLATSIHLAKGLLPRPSLLPKFICPLKGNVSRDFRPLFFLFEPIYSRPLINREK